MKKLITIVLCIVGCSQAGTIRAQGLPLTNVGDLINVGKMKIAGALHEKTDTFQVQQGGSRFINDGTAAELAVDSLILYSNDNKDGLFENKVGKVTGATTTWPRAVIVRRNFIDKDLWNHLSFPFNVREIKDPVSGKKISDGTLTVGYGASNYASVSKRGGAYPTKPLPGHFYVMYFDGKLRADSSYLHGSTEVSSLYPAYKKDVSGWRDTVFTASSVTSSIYFRKGVGFVLAAESGGLPTSDYYPYKCPDNLDFMTENTSDIQDLLEMTTSAQTKEVELQCFMTPKSDAQAPIFYYTNFGSGWNVVGGRFETLFDLKSGNISSNVTHDGSWNRTVYVRENNRGKSSTNFTQIDVDDNVSPRTGAELIYPYASFYVQVDTSVTAQSSLPSPIKMTFNSAGITSDWNSGVLFRSSEAVTANQDYIQIKLNSSDGRYIGEPTYIKINATNSNGYVAAEDAVTFNTGASDNTTIWTIASEKEGNSLIRLFKNSLRYTDNDEGSREIPIGFTTPAAGNYYITLNSLRNYKLKKAILLDKTNNSQTDLMQQDYAFSTSGPTGINDTRFVIFAQFGEPNSIIITEEGKEIYAYVENSELNVMNLSDGDRVRVLDLAGRVVATGIANSGRFRSNLAQKGVYVVNIVGKPSIKVINKY